MSGFFIDIGVIDPSNTNRFLCGIECDGATYHSSRSARDRDRLRQSILESRGWTIYRIWSTDWFHRRKDQEKKLLDALEQMRNGTHATAQEVDVVEALPADPIEVPAEVSQVNVIAYVEFEGQINSKKAPHEVPVYQLTQLVEQIVQVESPVHEDEIARRVTKAFGLEKAGSRIQSATVSALKASRNLIHSSGIWSIPNSTVHVRDRSSVKSKNLVSASMLPQIEIVAALKLVIEQSVRIHSDELIQATSRMFGFQRCGPDLKEVIQQALNSQLPATFVLDADGFVTLN